MSQKRYRGLFISFEGGEGAGKTTLIDSLYLQLKTHGHDVVRTREPGGTPLGEKIRSILLDPTCNNMAPFAELCLFLSSRAQQIQEILLPHLKEGRIILCDRFNDSSIVYQGAARGLGMDLVAQVTDLVCQGLQPDLTFYLDISPKDALKRTSHRQQDRIELEKESFHNTLREAYLELAHKEKRIHLLDATLDPQTVLQSALKLIHSNLTSLS